MPPKRATKSKAVQEIDSPTPSKTVRKETNVSRGGKKRSVKYDDELGMDSDTLSPLRRSPRQISKTVSKSTQAKPRKARKLEMAVESDSDLSDSPHIQKSVSKARSDKNPSRDQRSKAPRSVKTTPVLSPQSDFGSESIDSFESPRQHKSRAGVRRAESEDEDLTHAKHSKTHGSSKNLESPSSDASVLSNLDESPIVRGSGKATRSSPRINRTIGGKHTLSAASKNDPQKSAEFKKLKKQLAELTQKYEDLKQVGIQDAQKTFSEYKNNAEQQFEASDNAIQRLKEELSVLKEKKSTKKQLENQKLLEEQSKELGSLKEQLEKLQAENKELGEQAAAQASPSLDLSLQLYQELSHLNVVRIERTNQEIIFECELTGGKGTLRYLLRQDLDDLETYHYEPLLDDEDDSELIEHLPDYFGDTISFKKSYASLFFWRALDSLKETKKH